MIRITTILVTLGLFGSCSNDEKETVDDKRIVLRSDTLNVVKISDTLLIQENTCRGCAYENSTDFEITDSLGIIGLNSIVTTDNNPANVDGGSISKLLVLVPLKTGKTTFKLYKFHDPERNSQDSTNPISYSVDVKN
jgi:hypothetical protein